MICSLSETIFCQTPFQWLKQESFIWIEKLVCLSKFLFSFFLGSFQSMSMVSDIFKEIKVSVFSNNFSLSKPCKTSDLQNALSPELLAETCTIRTSSLLNYKNVSYLLYSPKSLFVMERFFSASSRLFFKKSLKCWLIFS